MSTQIFKNKIPNEFFFDLLNNICVKNEKYYLLNNAAFKKGLINNVLDEFFEKCKPYYHVSKQKYLEGKNMYKKLTTVVRQICNYNKLTYTFLFITKDFIFRILMIFQKIISNFIGITRKIVVIINSKFTNISRNYVLYKINQVFRFFRF